MFLLSQVLRQEDCLSLSNIVIHPIIFKNTFFFLLVIGNTPSHPRALMEIYNEINLVFMSANISDILHPIDQGVLSTFKPYY